MVGVRVWRQMCRAFGVWFDGLIWVGWVFVPYWPQTGLGMTFHAELGEIDSRTHGDATLSGAGRAEV
jgi:hypothetical protein